MSAIPEVTNASFQTEVLGSDRPVLVDFWAPWCGPCKMIAPHVERLSTSYAGRVKFVKLNTDENDVGFNYQVSGIPCLILFKDGKEADRLIGFHQERQIAAMLERHLAAA